MIVKGGILWTAKNRGYNCQWKSLNGQMKKRSSCQAKLNVLKACHRTVLIEGQKEKKRGEMEMEQSSEADKAMQKTKMLQQAEVLISIGTCIMTFNIIAIGIILYLGATV
jgi:hypothetical protein